jgi:hypothetical protein
MPLKKALCQAVQPVLELLEQRQLLSATLTLVNPAILPANDRLIFNYIQHPDPSVPNVIHDRQTLQITNTGDAPLVISSLVINGPWQFLNAPAGGYNNVTVTPGTPLNVNLQFTQRSLPAHSFNETNFTDNVNGGAEIDGSLTINSNDPTTPNKIVTLGGWWQNSSNGNAEPSLQTLANLMAGYQININSTSVPDLSQPNGAQLYGDEVYSTSWSAVDPNQPVHLQQLDAFHTQGNSAHVYWYTAANQNSHSLFTEPGSQGQSVLPTLSGGGLAQASFTPGGAFGLRVDNEFSNDAINVAAGNTGGGGHHFRFFPLRDESGNTVPNTYLVAMDYGVLQAENFDFQDNTFIVSNIRPSSTPGTPAGLTATNGAAPTLTWNAVNYAPAGYNVYRGTSQTGTFTLLTSTPITGTTTFTDNSAPAGAVFYHVTAIDSTQSPAAESFPATASANGGPVGAAYTFNSFSGQATSFNPLVNVTDATGTIMPSTVTVTSPNHGGTATVDPNSGLITYTPTSNFTGTETFTFTVADNNSAVSSPATITFHVSAPAVSSPIANNTVAATLTGAAVNIPVLNSDLPVTTFNLASLTITTQPTHGAVAVNSDGTVTYTPSGSFIGGDSFKYTVADNNGQVSNIANVDVNVGVEISSARGGNRAITYKDQNGTQVTVTLNHGVADVFFDGNGVAAAPVHGKVNVTGSSLHIREVALSGTTAASVLTIKGQHGGAVTLNAITDADPMGTINAKTSNLVTNGSTPTSSQPVNNVVPAGAISLAGVRSLQLKSANSAIIDTGNSGPARTNVVFSGNVTDTSLTSSVPLSTLKAAAWTNTQAQITNVFAPSISNLVIKGEFDSDLTLSDGVTPVVLGNAKITGQVKTGVWSFAGTARSINLGSADPTWGGINATGTINSMVVRTGNLASDIFAGSIGSLRVAGTLTGDVISTGNINSIRAAALDGSTITAGVQSGTAVDTATAGQLGSAIIRNVKLTTRTGDAFSNSQIMASQINSAALGSINTSNGGTPEGLAAVTVRSVNAKVGGVAVHLGPKQLTDETTLQAFLASKGVSFGDFVINLAT